MKTRRRFFLSFAWSLALACLLCAVAVSPAIAQNGTSMVRVMSRNIYAGTDLGYVLTAQSPGEFVYGVLTTIAEVDASNIPARASRVAAEIAASTPDLIALQEVTTWDITDLAGGHHTRTYDQLALLQQALIAAGMHYRVVVSQDLTDISAVYPPWFDARFTDHNVILARSDLPPGQLQVLGAEDHLFAAGLPPFQLPDGSVVPIKNGWLAVDVRFRGTSFKFVDTHLMSPTPGLFFDYTAGLQALQGVELLQGLSTATMPVILAGDFNSDAENAGVGPDQTGTAALIAANGFTDVWHALRPQKAGMTWPLFNEDPGVSVPFPSPVERIDLIFAAGPVPVSIVQTGITPSAKGLFASDHAGLVANLALDSHRRADDRGPQE